MSPTAEVQPTRQCLQALQRANQVRLARADLKRKVASGELQAAAVVIDLPWEAVNMTISDLLTAQRRWGHTRCRRFLHGVPMSESKLVGSMTERQRYAIAGMLGMEAQTIRDRMAAQMAAAA